MRVEAGAEPPGEEGGSGGSSTPSSGGASGSIGTGGASGGGTGGSMTGGSGGTGGSGDTGGSGGAGGMMPVPPDAAPDAPRGGTGGVDAMPPARDTAPVPPDTAPSSTLGHGLVSRWKLDEGSGATARDAVTASGNDGMISGGNSWAQTGFPMAKYPNMGALTFSGGVMDVGVKGMPSLTQATSISLWVNYGSVPGATQPFIGFGAAGTGRLKMGFNGGELAAWRGMGSTVLVGTAPPASGWHHVAYTFDGTTRRLYIDGTSRAMSTAAGETGAVTDGQIGSYGTQNFAGTLDEIRVYNRALTAAEVTALANGNE